MTFTTPPLDPTRKALLRNALVAEVARTPLPRPARPADVDLLAPPAPRWSGGPASGPSSSRRSWLPAVVAAVAAGVVAVGLLAGGGDSGGSAPAAPPADSPAPGALRVLGADELEALGAGRGGWGFVAQCLAAEGWNVDYHAYDDSVEWGVVGAADLRLCRAAAAVGLRSVGEVTDEVWAALYEHAREVARCAAAVGVPVEPLPDRDQFAAAYGTVREWSPYTGDPDLLTPAQGRSLDRCAQVP